MWVESGQFALVEEPLIYSLILLKLALVGPTVEKLKLRCAYLYVPEGPDLGKECGRIERSAA